jgi:Uma2 family endonuclease
MSSASPLPFVTYDEYLAQEAQADTKHEWLNGTVYAMSGGTPRQARLAFNLGRALGNALRGKPCAGFNADLRVRVRATGLATYPDLSVICGGLEADPSDKNAATNPTLLVEILSDATEAYDRGERFAHYRRIASLLEYVLVSQSTQRVEVFRRNADDTWTLHEVTEGAATFQSIDAVVPLAEIYEDPFA